MIGLAYACLWFLVFCLPWEMLTVSNGVTIITKVAGTLALAAAVGVTLVTGRVRRWHFFHVAALLFLVLAGVGLMVTHQLEEIPNKYFTFVQLFLLVLIVWQLAPDRPRIIGLLLAYVLGAYVAALENLWLYFREGQWLHRIAALGADPNDLAMAMVLALPMAWYLGMTHHRQFVRWVARGYLLIGLVAIGLTGSRGGMLTTMVALTIVPVTMSRLSSGQRRIAIVLMIISGALAVAYVPDTIVQRLATTTSTVEDLSIGGRFKLWKAGLVAFTYQPIMGYGPGAFKPAIMPQLGALAQVAHNSYISVLVEEGLVGFVLYAAMILTVWWSVARLPVLERRFAWVLLAAMAVAMFPLSWEHRKPVWFILSVLLGLSQAPMLDAARTVLRPAARQRMPTGRARPPLRPLVTPPLGQLRDRDART
jgi:O-antigen ligase